MWERTQICLLAMGVVFAVATMNAVAQEASPIPSFPSVVIRRIDDGDLKASYTRTGDVLTIKVRTKKGKAPEEGWAGVCIENRKPVDLQNFTLARATVESSERVVMDIKLEKTKYDEGTILLYDKQPVGKKDGKPKEWDLKEAVEVAGSGTLSQTRRMCFFVLADDFPAVNEVKVNVSNIRFDRR